MNIFTKQERCVLIVLAIVFFIGSIMEWCYKQVPFSFSAAQTDHKALQQACIDINQATLEELQRLPHIGKQKAQAIINYRLQKGLFKQKQEIEQIKGIGPKIYKRISPFIILTPFHDD